jgi:hypothetical protein
MRKTSMNPASHYHSDFFGVESSRAGLRICNDEVVGSIPSGVSAMRRTVEKSLS